MLKAPLNSNQPTIFLWPLKLAESPSIYNNPSVNLATGVAYVDGRAVGEGSRRGRITCTDRLRAKGEGQHGAWLTAGGQATIQHSKIVACMFYLGTDDCTYDLSFVHLCISDLL